MGKFVNALPMTPELGMARDSAALDDALVWNCYREAEAQGYHPTDGKPRLHLHEHGGDWWRSAVIYVAEDALRDHA